MEIFEAKKARDPLRPVVLNYSRYLENSSHQKLNTTVKKCIKLITIFTVEKIRTFQYIV